MRGPPKVTGVWEAISWDNGKPEGFAQMTPASQSHPAPSQPVPTARLTWSLTPAWGGDTDPTRGSPVE